MGDNLHGLQSDCGSGGGGGRLAGSDESHAVRARAATEEPIAKQLARLERRPQPKGIEQLRELCVMDPIALEAATKLDVHHTLLNLLEWPDTRLEALISLAVLSRFSEALRTRILQDGRLNVSRIMGLLGENPSRSDLWVPCTSLLASQVAFEPSDHFAPIDLRRLLTGVAKHADAQPQVVVHCAEALYAIVVYCEPLQDGCAEGLADAALRALSGHTFLPTLARAFRVSNASQQRTIRVGIVALCCIAGFKLPRKHENAFRIVGISRADAQDLRLVNVYSLYEALPPGPAAHPPAQLSTRRSAKRQVHDALHRPLTAPVLEPTPTLPVSPARQSSPAGKGSKVPHGRGLQGIQRVVGPAPALAPLRSPGLATPEPIALPQRPTTSHSSYPGATVEHVSWPSLTRSPEAKLCPSSNHAAQPLRGYLPRFESPALAAKHKDTKRYKEELRNRERRIKRNAGFSYWPQRTKCLLLRGEKEKALQKRRRHKLAAGVHQRALPPPSAEATILQRAVDAVAPGCFSEREVRQVLALGKDGKGRRRAKGAVAPRSRVAAHGQNEGVMAGKHVGAGANPVAQAPSLDISMDALLAEFEEQEGPVGSILSKASGNAASMANCKLDVVRNGVLQSAELEQARASCPKARPGRTKAKRVIDRNRRDRSNDKVKSQVHPSESLLETYDTFTEGRPFSDKLREMIETTQGELKQFEPEQACGVGEVGQIAASSCETECEAAHVLAAPASWIDEQPTTLSAAISIQSEATLAAEQVDDASELCMRDDDRPQDGVMDEVWNEESDQANTRVSFEATSDGSTRNSVDFADAKVGQHHSQDGQNDLRRAVDSDVAHAADDSREPVVDSVSSVASSAHVREAEGAGEAPQPSKFDVAPVEWTPECEDEGKSVSASEFEITCDHGGLGSCEGESSVPAGADTRESVRSSNEDVSGSEDGERDVQQGYEIAEQDHNSVDCKGHLEPDVVADSHFASARINMPVNGEQEPFHKHNAFENDAVADEHDSLAGDIAYLEELFEADNETAADSPVEKCRPQIDDFVAVSTAENTPTTQESQPSTTALPNEAEQVTREPEPKKQLPEADKAQIDMLPPSNATVADHTFPCDVNLDELPDHAIEEPLHWSEGGEPAMLAHGRENDSSAFHSAQSEPQQHGGQAVTPDLADASLTQQQSLVRFDVTEEPSDQGSDSKTFFESQGDSP